MNTYVLSFDPFGTKLSTAQLLGYIAASRDIHQWLAPFSGTLILQSSLSLVALSAKLRVQFESSLFLLTAVSPAVLGGSMPQEFWTWVAAAHPTLPIWPPPVDPS